MMARTMGCTRFTGVTSSVIATRCSTSVRQRSRHSPPAFGNRSRGLFTNTQYACTSVVCTYRGDTRGETIGQPGRRTCCSRSDYSFILTHPTTTAVQSRSDPFSIATIRLFSDTRASDIGFVLETLLPMIGSKCGRGRLKTRDRTGPDRSARALCPISTNNQYPKITKIQNTINLK
jgi:hypothetical protein